jgi:hypothetical protein
MWAPPSGDRFNSGATGQRAVGIIPSQDLQRIEGLDVERPEYCSIPADPFHLLGDEVEKDRTCAMRPGVSPRVGTVHNQRGRSEREAAPIPGDRDHLA